MKISNALAESLGVMTESELHLLREEDLNTSELLDLIYPVADRVIALDKFSGVDLDVIRALLFYGHWEKGICLEETLIA